MPLFAGGTDVVALRLALKEAAVRGCQEGAVDVTGAFLNAPLQAVDQEGELTVAMRPPAVLVRMGLIPKKELWIVNKAMYGLRQSPRCWSDYRDDEMRRWRVSYGKRWLKMRSEPNLWLVKKVEDDLNPEELVGLLLVYVDDFMPLGVEGVPQALMEKIKGAWESSERQGAGKVLRGEHLCDGAGDHLGPDGLHQGDHRSEQCHWQVGDPHEQGVQRARGRDRDHGGGDSDGSAPGGRVDLAGHPE